MALPGDRTAHSAHSAHPGATRLTAGVVLPMILSAPSLAAWEGYERLTRESLLARLAEPASRQSRADLTGTDLRDAVLIDTDLTSANLTRADLTGADLQGVRGLESATKSGTRGLPPGATISSR